MWIGIPGDVPYARASGRGPEDNSVSGKGLKAAELGIPKERRISPRMRFRVIRGPWWVFDRRRLIERGRMGAEEALSY